MQCKRDSASDPRIYAGSGGILRNGSCNLSREVLELEISVNQKVESEGKLLSEILV